MASVSDTEYISVARIWTFAYVNIAIKSPVNISETLQLANISEESFTIGGQVFIDVNTFESLHFSQPVSSFENQFFQIVIYQPDDDRTWKIATTTILV